MGWNPLLRRAAVALVITGLVAACSSDEPEATGIIRALALCALISAPASVFSGILQKRMQFGKRLMPELLKAIAKGAVGIPLALWGFGAWSLVFSQIAGVVVGLALLNTLRGK